MQTAVTRNIENIAKGFKGFTRPTAEAIEALALERLKEFPATSVEQGPSKKNGKFCKKHWLLNIHWKVTAVSANEWKPIPSEEFPTEAEALAAQEAYLSQNAKGIKVRTMLLMDGLRGDAKKDLWRDYEAKVRAQADSLAKVTRADAKKDLSRM